MYKVKAVLPTRGLIFAKTIQSLQDNGIFDPVIVIDKPIPESHNEGVARALAEDPTHILMVEEDMALPPLSLRKMLNLNADIVALDYPVDNGTSTLCYKGDQILWCGLGATLIRAEVFHTLGEPYFDNSYSYKVLSQNPLELERVERANRYGGHDINFCLKSAQKGFSIKTISQKADHLRCNTLERGKNNNEAFQIWSLKHLKEQHYA